MKAMIAVLILVASTAAVAQEKNLFGPITSTSKFERVIDGNNVYFVLDDAGKTKHTMTKGPMVQADPDKDKGQALFVTTFPAGVFKCAVGKLFYRREKPKGDTKPEPNVDYESWQAASIEGQTTP